ncbi:MAG TPA: ABC transporter transmembrane domain-containing protein [Burkholderiaceae bacterium]|nr:ABC transporter transmembrane domain-containing protein [Burkholderiaceae bacterium]
MANDEAARSRVFAGLWEALWRYRQRTLLALGLLVLAKISAVLVPLLLKLIIDSLSRPESLATPYGSQAGPVPPGTPTLVLVPVFLLLGYALLRFAGALFTELRDMLFARVTQRAVASFAERSFGHLLALNPRFHVQRNTGALIREVERGTAGVGFLLGPGLFTVVPTAVEVIAVLLVMASGYSLWFSLIIIATFFVYAGCTTTLTSRRALRQRQVNELDARATGHLADTLLNYETVKAHAREGFERERYAGVLDQWVEGSVRNQRTLSVLHLGQGAIIAAGVAAVMLLAGEQVVRGTMTVGDLVLVNSYLLQICLPLNALGFVFREGRDALASTEKLFALLERKPEIEDRPDAAPLSVARGEVVFERVDFSYEPGHQILQDLSFIIPAGKTVAVVGGRGSGKSTLARLLLRLYDVQAGRIAIDGQDVRSLKLATLREAIGVVPQDTVLFDDSIAFNIGYGRAGASLAEIIDAAKAAQVHEFILALPEGYDTRVGERGLKLSGGEKQRIAIARAFLKNPPIMIFDEATSALDTRAERAIQGELDRIALGRSTLMIAHRLSTIVDADQIIVMDKGRIVERGRHDELLAREGLYAQLWNLQRQQAQVERLERRLARQSVNLAVLMANAVDGLRESFDTRGVRIYSGVDLDNARVTGDPGTLAQALREMCMQALEATPVGGRIELKLERRDAFARLSITDGRQAASPRLKLVSRAPLQAPPYGTDTAPDPLQLRSTIERQGGVFNIEPPAAGHGMRYVIELPLRAVGADEAPAAAEASPRALQGLSVMAIDDAADAREALQMLLEAEGARVQACDGAATALAWLEQHERREWPQAIVCDISLGDGDGYQLIRRIRALEQQRGVTLDARVPAIALTGHAEASDRTHALMAGFQVHLAKPADPRELIATLLALAGRAGHPAAA